MGLIICNQLIDIYCIELRLLENISKKEIIEFINYFKGDLALKLCSIHNYNNGFINAGLNYKKKNNCAKINYYFPININSKLEEKILNNELETLAANSFFEKSKKVPNISSKIFKAGQCINNYEAIIVEMNTHWTENKSK